jgi:hypothetical protein
MKRILLTTTALVGFAGAAAADVSWSGNAVLGHNDDIEGGVYADVDLDVTLSQTLDNGLTASATFGFELEDESGSGLTNGNFSTDDNIVISLTSDTAGLYYGDTAFAAETYWSGVTNMNEDGFSEADGETVIRGEIMFGGVTAGLSYVLHTDEVALGGTGSGELDQLSVGATADLGNFNVILGYQEDTSNAFDPAFNEDFNSNDVLGLAVGTSFGGADVTFAYAAEDSEESIGLEVSYPVGDVTVTAFYVSESAIDDSYGLAIAYAAGPLSIDAFYHDGGDEDAGVHVSYDVGNGITAYVGYSDDDGQYVAGELDLGGGATFLVSYAEDDDNPANDEIGPQEYLHGTTVELSVAF